MEKLFFLAIGAILGYGIAFFIHSVLRNRKKTSNVSGGGGAGDPKPSNDNQTT